MATAKPKGPEIDEAGIAEVDDAALGIGQDEPVADFTTSPLFRHARSQGKRHCPFASAGSRVTVNCPVIGGVIQGTVLREA